MVKMDKFKRGIPLHKLNLKVEKSVSGYRGLGLDSQPLSTADTTFIIYVYTGVISLCTPSAVSPLVGADVKPQSYYYYVLLLSVLSVIPSSHAHFNFYYAEKESIVPCIYINDERRINCRKLIESSPEQMKSEKKSEKSSYKF